MFATEAEYIAASETAMEAVEIRKFILGLEEDVFSWLDDVWLVDGVLDGAFGGVGDEEVVVGEGVVMISSSLEMLTNSYLGGIMVSLIFLEGLEE
ncbi:hypothetical protein Tco_1001730 [Tanacetum coccineum]